MTTFHDFCSIKNKVLILERPPDSINKGKRTLQYQRLLTDFPKRFILYFSFFGISGENLELILKRYPRQLHR